MFVEEVETSAKRTVIRTLPRVGSVRAMKPRTLAQLIAGGRVAMGVTLLASPARVTRAWVGEAEAERPGARVLAAGLGGRDLVIGAGVLASVRSGGHLPWLVASACSDLFDLVATLRLRAELPRDGVIVTGLVAGGAAAAGAWLVAQGEL